MYPCKKCAENRWTKTKSGNYLDCVCDNCGYSFEIELPEKEKVDNTKPCRKCGGVIILKTMKITAKKLKKTYHYSHVYRCNACKVNYYDDKFKINH